MIVALNSKKKGKEKKDYNNLKKQQPRIKGDYKKAVTLKSLSVLLVFVINLKTRQKLSFYWTLMTTIFPFRPKEL